MIESLFNNPELANHHLDSIKNVPVSNEMLIPSVSYWSLQKSINNLQDIARFYFPLLGISGVNSPQIIPLLVFIEATIYQADEEYERHVSDPNFFSQHMFTLRDILIQLNLFDEQIKTELFTNGLTYYRFEKKFCLGEIPTQEDINKASMLKCYDLRVMQLILLKLTNQPYNEEFLQTSQLSDRICEINCDLADYEKDIRRNVINIYRMFVRLYGIEAPKHLRHHLESLNSQLQSGIKLIEQTQPEIAKKFIELWKEDLKLLKIWNAETEQFAVPEIPDPILEDWSVVSP